MHGIECADNIWFTCCALQNMLLHVDGLDKRWKCDPHTCTGCTGTGVRSGPHDS